jgi:hypothetical protein
MPRTVSSSHRFSGATDKPSSTWFWDPNQETIAMILRTKSPNRSYRFWGTNRETWATGFEAKMGETVTISFEAKSEKTVATGFEVKPDKVIPVVLRPNHWQTVPVGLRPNHW